MRRLHDPCPNPDDPDARPAPAPGNLPAELNPFVGRADELAELGGLLEESRLVTVAGVAGVGKTRCVIRIAALREKRYCDGVLLAELSAVRHPDLLEHALIDALGLTDHTSRPPRAVLVEHLSERRTLL
ncbi:regulator, partial [Streptomyces sp. NPDC020755]